MLKRSAVILSLLALAYVFAPRIHSATARPEAGLSVRFAIWSMWSLQSDWNRSVIVSYEGERIKRRLFEDTGWWRGSNLYRHTSGAYVVHEGKNGCFAFTLKPLVFVRTLEASCVKGSGDGIEGHSEFYSGLTYIGRFYETRRDEEGVRLRYAPASAATEVELPERL